MFYIRFFNLKNERFARSLFFGEQCERIAQVAPQKWAMWVNRSGRSPQMSDHERIAQGAHQKWANEQIARFFERSAQLLIFSQKTSDSLRKLLSEFPALRRGGYNPRWWWNATYNPSSFIVCGEWRALIGQQARIFQKWYMVD